MRDRVRSPCRKCPSHSMRFISRGAIGLSLGVRVWVHRCRLLMFLGRTWLFNWECHWGLCLKYFFRVGLMTNWEAVWTSRLFNGPLRINCVCWSERADLRHIDRSDFHSGVFIHYESLYESLSLTRGSFKMFPRTMKWFIGEVFEELRELMTWARGSVEDREFSRCWRYQTSCTSNILCFWV